jgi:hypothetical protein
MTPTPPCSCARLLPPPIANEPAAYPISYPTQTLTLHPPNEYGRFVKDVGDSKTVSGGFL